MFYQPHAHTPLSLTAQNFREIKLFSNFNSRKSIQNCIKCKFFLWIFNGSQNRGTDRNRTVNIALFNLKYLISYQCFMPIVPINIIYLNLFNIKLISGFTGTNCETEINECESNTCPRYSVCVDKINHYRCICTSRKSLFLLLTVPLKLVKLKICF